MKHLVLLTQRLAHRQHGFDDGCQHGPSLDELADPRLELAGADRPNLEAKISECPPQIVLYVDMSIVLVRSSFRLVNSVRRSWLRRVFTWTGR